MLGASDQPTERHPYQNFLYRKNGTRRTKGCLLPWEAATDEVRTKRRFMKIYRRVNGGWSEQVENKSRKQCDVCLEPLWVNPGGGKYCNGNFKKCEAPDAKTLCERLFNEGKTAREIKTELVTRGLWVQKEVA
jgi:hypothetical protein